MKLSAIVITLNEERNIRDCLQSLSFADEKLVIDSGSKDATVSLSRTFGAAVLEHPFTDFSSQRNFALEQAQGDWVLFLDADERVTPELASEIKIELAQNPSYVFAIPRHTYFFGKRLRFCDARYDAPIRLFPRRNVQWTQPVHETIKTTLPCRTLKNPITHYSTRDWAHYRQKMAAYIPLELDTLRRKGVHPSFFKVMAAFPVKFLQIYFLKLGFLDGIAGLQYAILSAYYTLTKHWLYRTAKNHE